MPGKSFYRTEQFPQQQGCYQIDWLKLRELNQVLRLEHALFPEPLTPGKLLRYYFAFNAVYIVIRENRTVAAYIGFHVFGPAAHTISMAVHHKYRRQGLAALLQKTADRAASNRGCRWFTGEVRISNRPQLKLLESLGWIEIGRCPHFFQNGEDAVVVWNWL